MARYGRTFKNRAVARLLLPQSASIGEISLRVAVAAPTLKRWRSFETGERVQIHPPLATRPWQHVLEPLSGYLILAIALIERQPLNANTFNSDPSAEDVWTVRRLHQVESFAMRTHARIAYSDGGRYSISNGSHHDCGMGERLQSGVDSGQLSLAQNRYYQSFLDQKND